MELQRKRLGILVGGGPAPGINSAISATVIEAVNEDLDVIGIYDGYEYLMQGRTDMVRPLTIEEVSRIHFQGGSILRTARANPTRNPDDMRRTLQALQSLDIRALVTIGGDDTAFAASEVAKASRGAIRVAHIPKTIDNDLPLPGGVSTFGFETARHVGTQLVRNLMEDARTTNRWIFVVVMGRKAGHLALGIGKAAGATLTIIPEEFSQERIRLNDVSRMLEAAILKRRVMGSEHGVAVIAEGISEKLDPEELANMPGVEMVYDPYGHIRLGEIPLTTLLKRQVQDHFAARHDTHSIVDVTLGYELRCAQAIPFDVDYTRTLGYGAVRFLLSEPADGRTRQAGFICLEGGHLNVLPFDDLRDTTTGRVRIRVVDVRSEHYHVARKYMIRLEQSDLDDAEMRTKLAAAAHMTPNEFLSAFGAAVTAPEGWCP
ncbi:MAG: diphosphate--fructose-6-phosphate 1-phosphotransferase [Candidatus Entotheonellia bacterium]